jgi:predicted dehydrogenase
MGLIGLGKMGRYHLNLYDEVGEIKLKSVCDVDKSKLIDVGKRGIKFYTNYKDMLRDVDAVTIAAPTVYHYNIAKTCLMEGKHVLVEKPITTKFVEAEELFDIAEKKNLVLNIGHVERFNGATQELKKIIHKPYLVESRRVGPYEVRNDGDSIVLDLLIHDIDIILNIIDGKVEYVHATGSPVYSGIPDLASVHIAFDNNVIANMLVSRVTQKKDRTLSISQEDAFIYLDYTNQDINIYRKGQSQHIFGNRELRYRNEYILERLFVYKDNPLKLEIRNFVQNILGKKERIVTVEHELMSLKLALKVDELLTSRILR